MLFNCRFSRNLTTPSTANHPAPTASQANCDWPYQFFMWSWCGVLLSNISSVLSAVVEPVFNFIITGSTPSIDHFDTEHLTWFERWIVLFRTCLTTSNVHVPFTFSNLPVKPTISSVPLNPCGVVSPRTKLIRDLSPTESVLKQVPFPALFEFSTVATPRHCVTLIEPTL